MQRLWMSLGAVSGLVCVALSSIAAHALMPPARTLVQEGLSMQFPHALALLAVGLWVPRGGRLANCAGAGFALGVVAPIGGTCLMAGWLLLTVSALRAR